MQCVFITGHGMACGESGFPARFLGLNHLPSGRFPANAAWLAVQVMAHNLPRWTARIGLGEPVATTKTLRRRFFSLAGRITRKATPHPASSPGLALAEPVQKRSGETARPATPLLTTPTATIRRTTQSPRRPAPGWPHVSPAAVCQADFALRRRCGPSTSPWRGCHTPCPAGLERIKATRSLSGPSHPLLPRGGQILSVDLGLGRALHGT